MLPALTSLSFSAVPCLTDETLRLAGQRHPALASLALASCGALTGAHLGQHGAFAVLRCLAIECCDTITG